MSGINQGDEVRTRGLLGNYLTYHHRQFRTETHLRVVRGGLGRIDLRRPRSEGRPAAWHLRL